MTCLGLSAGDTAKMMDRNPCARGADALTGDREAANERIFWRRARVGVGGTYRREHEPPAREGALVTLSLAERKPSLQVDDLGKRGCPPAQGHS